MNDIDIFDRLNIMPKDELESFLLTANITSKMSAVVGITSVFLALMFNNMIVSLLTVMVLYLFGYIAVGADNIKTHILHLLETKFKDK